MFTYDDGLSVILWDVVRLILLRVHMMIDWELFFLGFSETDFKIIA